MLPSIAAKEIHQSVSHYLREAFRTTTQGFIYDDRSIMEHFLDAPDRVYKGPWLDIKLPFRKSESTTPPFRNLKLPKGFVPYMHQQQAFDRLTIQSNAAIQSTIVATGTGSGKTECFMYPLLEHCLQNRSRGIKAIIIYPMNALATDQARRFAKEVHNTGSDIRVGMYTGDRTEPTYRMSETQVITARNILREDPPDVLLTNYKMLDYLLIRPEDQPLWRYNDPGVLRYLIVDELHTFDGAQGTDLACLIRRLRARLQIGEELACVGTSATIGGGEDSIDKLREYAETVFDSTFDGRAIIGESRQSVEEYLREAQRTSSEQGRGEPQIHENAQTKREERVFARWPVDSLDALRDTSGSNEAYIEKAARAWFVQEDEHGNEVKPLAFENLSDAERLKNRIELRQRLRGHAAFQLLLEECEQLANVQEIAERWTELVQGENGPLTTDDALVLIDSLVSLIAYARHKDNGRVQPMLHVRSQIWLRELRRMVSSVEKTPRLVHNDDVTDSKDRLYLPLVHCRHCLSMAWGAKMPHFAGKVERDHQSFYNAWFSRNSDVRLFYPMPDGAEAPRGQEGTMRFLCGDCGELHLKREHACSGKGDDDRCVQVWAPEITKKQRDDERHVLSTDCPHCREKDSLMIVGARASSVSSVAISQLFGSNFVDDRKLIAFSDSVQDAAHRAGFFGARTYRNVVRLAMEQRIGEFEQEPTVHDFIDSLAQTWRHELGDASFVGTFIAPNIQWFSDYETLVRDGALPRGSRLPDDVEKRLRWDAMLEFGANANIGRSLERGGVATLSVDPLAVRRAAENMQRRVKEQVELLRDVSVDECEAFIRGALTHWRYKGAWDVEEMRGLVKDRGQTFVWSQRRFSYLPGYGRFVHPPSPILLTTPRGGWKGGADYLLGTTRNTAPWMVDWFRRLLASDRPLVDNTLPDVMRGLLDALQAEELLVLVDDVFDVDAYLMNPRRWTVRKDVVQLRCGVCRRLHDAPEVDLAHWEGSRCLRKSCEGTIQRLERASRTARVVPKPTRLVPVEHTGLLDAETRAATETSFIEGKETWDVNLLSSTPTLEMGIDIGDLSSVLLCSVPPTQANYLQRIGRAGRRDGNALALVVANGVNHDNYFYADPIEMMAGDIATPGVFLQATAVLERQLTAFCFDRWVMTGVGNDAIPKELKPVLDALKREKETAFPHPFLEFIAQNQDALLNRFLDLFPTLGGDGKAHLRAFLKGGKSEYALEGRILDRLQRTLDGRDAFVRRRNSARRDLRALRKGPSDQAIKATIEEVEDEIAGLSALINDINKRHTLNFFTDEGLLPNYAFPEEGVTLDSVVVRQASARERQDATGGTSRKNVYTSMQFQRSATAALSELAPESTFFAAAHRLSIEQVDLDLSNVEEWRFCDRCHYSQHIVETETDPLTCPRCYSEQWADIGQKRTLIRLRQVYAYANSRTDHIDDSQESRSPAMHLRQLLVDIPPDSQTETWALEDEELPFGFEYIPSATFREINFGGPGQGGETFSVAGSNEHRRGFQVCKHCGKVKRPKNPHDKRPRHSRDCVIIRDKREETDDDWLESLYLYRELQSETIRILLPLAEIEGTELSKQSFMAAIQLGLRKRFQGNVQHLDMTEMSSYDPERGEKQFLLIYDRVPGGTGYLKDLLRDPKHLFDVFQQALDTLIACPCEDDPDPDRDGCYRCILAYAQARYQKAISRKHAIDLLEALVQKRDTLVDYTSLDDVDMSSLLESRFEERLVEELKKEFDVKSKAGSGRTGYFIYAGENTWELIPQEEFLDAHRGTIVTRSDFMLRRVSAGDAKDFESYESHIFTDGFEYHADSVRADIEKRQRILATGKRVWVLSWRDLPTDDAPGNSDLSLLLTDGRLPKGQMATYHAYPEWKKERPDLESTIRKGSYAWLSDFIRHPEATETTLQDAAIDEVLMRLRLIEMVDSEELEALLSPRVIDWQEEEKTMLGGAFDSFLRQTNVEDELHERNDEVARLLVALRQSDAARASTWAESATAMLWIDDTRVQKGTESRASWEAFWAAFNLLQFAPNFAVTSASSLKYLTADNGWPDWPYLETERRKAVDLLVDEAEAWPDVFDPLIGAQLDHESLKRIHAAGVPEPEVGVDIKVGIQTEMTAELVWADKKVALSLEPPSKPIEGWTILVATDDHWVENVLSLLMRES